MRDEFPLSTPRNRAKGGESCRFITARERRAIGQKPLRRNDFCRCEFPAPVCLPSIRSPVRPRSPALENPLSNQGVSRFKRHHCSPLGRYGAVTQVGRTSPDNPAKNSGVSVHPARMWNHRYQRSSLPARIPRAAPSTPLLGAPLTPCRGFGRQYSS